MTTVGPLTALLGLVVVLARRPRVVLGEAALLQALALPALSVVAVVARALSVSSPGLLMLLGVLVVAIALPPILTRPPTVTGLLMSVGLPAAGALPVVTARVFAVPSLLAAVLLL